MTSPAAQPFTRAPGWLTVASGAPEVGLGAAFLVTWVDPARFGTSMVSFALELMLLEFILIHSAGFMGVRAAKAGSTRARVIGILGLGLFYSLFVGGFCLALGRIRPLVSFWIVTAQRLAGDLLDPKPGEETRAWFGTNLAVNAILYLLLAGATVMLPVPALGITPPVRQGLGIGGKGLWVDEPQRVVVLAGLYYVVRGVMTMGAWPRRAFPAQDTIAGQLKADA